MEDLADMARVGTGKLRLKTGPVVLGEVLERAVETCRPRAEGRNQTLGLLLPPAPLAVEADADRLQQVFVNLIMNAVKYTPEGGEVRVEGTKAGGEAIAKEYTEKRYHQPDDEYQPSWRFDGIAADGALLHAVGQRLANGNEWPNWSQDSEFRAARDASAAERGGAAPAPAAAPAPVPAEQPQAGERG